MVAQNELLINTLKEFLESAQDDESKNRIKSAITMYFKTIVESCDFLIYNQILKVPYNHKNRFELLEKLFPEIYDEVSLLFKIYRKTYSQNVYKEDLEKVKNGCLKIIAKAEFDKHLSDSIKE